MTLEEVYEFVKREKPTCIHLTGKTSTGKSTFARRLSNGLGYNVVELDRIVRAAVIDTLDLEDEGQVFREIYKGSVKADWIDLFIDATHAEIKKYIDAGQKVIIDGAIANLDTLQKILEPYKKLAIIYIHPSDLSIYVSYLTERFKSATLLNNAGLPVSFWELIPKESFKVFCQDGVITEDLRNGIAAYAEKSQQESVERLEAMRAQFSDILVAEL